MRGQERFNIYCSPCHGRLGDGNGMIVQRGYKRPTSYHIERLRTAPIGYFFNVMTDGFGVMPTYAPQIPVRGPLGDRRLHPRAAVQPERQAGGAAPRRPATRPGGAGESGGRRHAWGPQAMTTDSIRRPSTASPAFAAPADVDRLQTSASSPASSGWSLSGIGLFVSPDYFFRGYLVGWVFWLGISARLAGALHARPPDRRGLGRWSAGGSWRPPRASLPLLALLAIPLFFFGMQTPL